MTTIICKNIEHKYNNFGMQAERALAYTLTGELRDHDHVPFDKGSDIPEFHMSVKTGGFSLMSGRYSPVQEFGAIVDEFFSRVKSERFAYITRGMEVYVMDKGEFREFVNEFCYMGRESSSNGGHVKVQMRHESRKTLAWLMSRAGA